MTINHPIESYQETGTSHFRNLLSLLFLIIAAVCLYWGSGISFEASSAQATAIPSSPPATPTEIPIDRIQVGDWVFAPDNPSQAAAGNQRLSLSSADQLNIIDLQGYKADGGVIHLTLLRPAAWLQQHHVMIGQPITLSLTELGFVGQMQVTDLRSCPALLPRPGPEYEQVTGTVVHRRDDVIELTIQGLERPLGVTPNHPIWSADRRDFISAGDLVVGEQLLLADGSPTYLTGTTSRPGSHAVYNLEVNGKHVYHVASTGLLVHNTNGGVPCPIRRDLTGGPHAPDRPLEEVIDRSIHGNKKGPNGKWNSKEAVENAAAQTQKKGSVPIAQGDGIVVTPLPNMEGVWLREADRAAVLPKKSGRVHTFPITPEHPLYGVDGTTP